MLTLIHQPPLLLQSSKWQKGRLHRIEIFKVHLM
jgi:hypothetical protein